MNVMNSVFAALETLEINYVHFKSNMHLERSFEGKADFDILIDRSKHHLVMNVLIAHGGKLFKGPSEKYYPGVEDWLLFDNETGIIYHLHLHCQLASGKSCLKDYIIPWGKECFQSKIRNEQFNLYTTSAEMELMLLTVRIVLKSNWKDCLNAVFHRYSLSKSMNEERKDLLRKIDKEKLLKLIKQLIPEADNEAFYHIAIGNNISSMNFRELSKIVRNMFQLNRYNSPLISSIKSSVRYNRYRIKCHLRNRGGKFITKKISTSGGLIIAFVGLDGSGKSTTTKEIVKWLSSQIDCRRFYLGEGEATTNFIVSIFKKIVNINQKSQNNEPSRKGYSSVNQKPSLYKQFKQSIAAQILLIIEKGNNKNIRFMNIYRQKGGISLLDRYPQLEIEGCNDGPKMCNYEKYFGAKNKFLTRMKQEELKELQIVKAVKPDIIFRLNITVGTSMARRPEQKDESVFKEKIERLNQINFQNANIIDINAEQPYDIELLEIKRTIWAYI